MPSRRHVAYHEAGHAVVARVLGCNLQHVTAVSELFTDGYAGEAGPFAHMKKFSISARRAERAGAWDCDFADAERMTESLCICRQFGALVEGVTYELKGKDLDALWSILQDDAHNLVDTNWPGIVRVAEELMTRPVLFQDDVDVLIERGGTTPTRSRLTDVPTGNHP